MGNLVELRSRPMQINHESVEMLEETLAKAKAGEISEVAIAALLADGSCETQSTASDHFQQMIGAVGILHHRMIDECRGAE